MTLRIGNMWYDTPRPDVILVTGNCTVKPDGALVMGRGAAYDAKKRNPGIDFDFGSQILGIPNIPCYPKRRHYGLLMSERCTDPQMGLFQVKWDFWEKADIDVIAYSVDMMNEWITINSLYDLKIAMNFPGVGYGQLGYDMVAPVVASLPDNVHLWMTRDPRL